VIIDKIKNWFGTKKTKSVEVKLLPAPLNVQ